MDAREIGLHANAAGDVLGKSGRRHIRGRRHRPQQDNAGSPLELGKLGVDAGHRVGDVVVRTECSERRGVVRIEHNRIVDRDALGGIGHRPDQADHGQIGRDG
jgi:hypothetical protein